MINDSSETETKMGAGFSLWRRTAKVQRVDLSDSQHVSSSKWLNYLYGYLQIQEQRTADCSSGLWRVSSQGQGVILWAILKENVAVHTQSVNDCQQGLWPFPITLQVTVDEYCPEHLFEIWSLKTIIYFIPTSPCCEAMTDETSNCKDLI